MGKFGGISDRDGRAVLPLISRLRWQIVVIRKHCLSSLRAAIGSARAALSGLGPSWLRYDRSLIFRTRQLPVPRRAILLLRPAMAMRRQPPRHGGYDRS